MSQADYDYCQALVREADKDRFIADLFAAEERRPHLFALHAFNVEIARVRELVREPMAGEIRLQWWYDALGGEGRGEVQANPVAAALLKTIAHCDLPTARLRQAIEAHRNDLYREPIATLDEFANYARATAGTMFVLSAKALDPVFAVVEAAAAAAGEAYAMAGILRSLPRHASQGHIFLPGEILDRNKVDRSDILAGRSSDGLRAAIAELTAWARDRLVDFGRVAQPASLWPAFLPVALTGQDLARIAQAGDPFTARPIARWRRQWWLWRAARRGF
jgi:phytoene synthase